MMEAPRDPGRAAAVALAGRAAAATCGVLVVALAAFVLWRSAALLALVYVAAVIAVVLDRPVAALVRRGLGRTWALALVLSGVLAVTLAAVVVAFGPLAAQVRGLGLDPVRWTVGLRCLPHRERRLELGRTHVADGRV